MKNRLNQETEEMDPETEKMVNIMNEGKKNLPEDTVDWRNSRFEWLRTLSASRKGKLFEEAVTQYFSSKGFAFDNDNNINYDRLLTVNSRAGKKKEYKIEIKGSILWQQTEIYSYCGIKNTDFDLLILLGISPKKVHCWIIPKDKLMEKHKWKKIKGVFMPQYGGTKADNGHEVYRMSFRPRSVTKPKVPEWLNEFGGSLEKAHQFLRQYTHKTPLL